MQIIHGAVNFFPAR